jgi:hypothetical protein
MTQLHLQRASHTAPWQPTTSAYWQVRNYSSVTLTMPSLNEPRQNLINVNVSTMYTYFDAVTPVGGHLGWVSPADPLGAPSVHTTVVDFFSAVLDAREPAAAKPPSEGRPIAGMVH